MWGDWELYAMRKLDVSSSKGMYIQMTIKNTGTQPRAFPADHLALVDNFNRWYQISSLYMPGEDSYSSGADLEGVELDPMKSVKVWVSGDSELERDIRYLVAMDQTLAIDVGET